MSHAVTCRSCSLVICLCSCVCWPCTFSLLLFVLTFIACAVPQAHALEEKLRALQGSQGQGQQEGGKAGQTGTKGQASTQRPSGAAPWPAGGRHNPYEDLELTPAQINSFSLQKSFKVGKGVT